jgi:predicted nucleic acid-binding protein
MKRMPASAAFPGSTAFVDTNVLVYAMVPQDLRSVAAVAILQNCPAISVQVLNEFANVTRRKLRWSWPRIEEGLAVVQQLCGPARPLTLDTHRSAIDIARRHNFSVYDALIVAAALEAGCTTLYSEDMQNGQKIHGINIRNPFAFSR